MTSPFSLSPPISQDSADSRSICPAACTGKQPQRSLRSQQLKPKQMRAHQYVLSIEHVLTMWKFPEIGVPPVIIHFGIFPYKPTIFGYPHLWKPPYIDTNLQTTQRIGTAAQFFSRFCRCWQPWWHSERGGH